MAKSNHVLQFSGIGGITHTYTNATGATINQHDIVILGDQGLAAIAAESIANAATGNLWMPGLAKVSGSVKGHDGSANAAIAAYDKIYQTSGEQFADVDTSATFLGFTLGGVASGATETEDILVVATPLA
jgi:hypothetical protein